MPTVAYPSRWRIGESWLGHAIVYVFWLSESDTEVYTNLSYQSYNLN